MARPLLQDQACGSSRSSKTNSTLKRGQTMFVTTTRRSLVPFSGLRRLNSVLDEAFAAWPFQIENGDITSAWTPAVDISEDKSSVKIVAELPGVKSEDVKLSIENKVLTIRGEKKHETEEKTERVHRYERSYGVFERAFALPNSVDPEKIEAKYENGILTVTVAKIEKALPREIPVKAA